MTPRSFTESVVEEAALEWLEEIGYTHIGGPDIAPGEAAAERESYFDVVLAGRLRQALARLNPDLPAGALEDAYRQLTRTESPSLIVNNHRFHQLLINGVSVSYQDDGRTVYADAQALDFDDPANNNFLAINQFTVRKEGTLANPDLPLEGTRRPDIILFVNGLPLVVIELKNVADEHATTHSAYKQLQTYKAEIPSLFIYNALLIVADGTDARMGALTSSWEWFKPWRTIDGKTVETSSLQLRTLIKGIFDPGRFLDLIRYFTLFEVHKAETIKKIASYHQYHAVDKAVAATRHAIESEDRRVGVIWHTQGSGKSLSMLFYAGKIIQEPALANPTLVLLTDRNDLDDQLYDTFAVGHELLRQQPAQAESRVDLREKLQVAAGGVVFTTIQKFYPEDGRGVHPLLSERQNIIFIVDEAHRTQYGFHARYLERKGELVKVYGLAKYMRDALPNAAFIGFTGTPISLADKDTRNVFGDYIDIYDIQRAVHDEATVPIYYDARHAKIKLNEAMIPRIDPDFEELTEHHQIAQKEYLKTKWAAMEKIVGDPDRIEIVAQDIVEHYEQRDATLSGKAMIVCMSREICVKTYDALVALRPGWEGPDDNHGMLKVVMSGSASDDANWQKHIRPKRSRKELGKRFRDTSTDFKIVIVCDMWLTGFDAPSLHTMYLDKPIKGHNLMQAIARVNRVFENKNGGLVVAYLPLATQLQEALKDYTEADRENTGRLQDEAAEIMMEKYDIVRSIMHGFDYSPFFTDSPTQRLTTLANAVDFVLIGREKNRDRTIDAVTLLGRAYALAMPHEKALAIREEVAFFQAVQAPLIKTITTSQPTGRRKTPQEIEAMIQQMIAHAYTPEGIVDLFSLAGLDQPDISILSDAFLLEVQALPQRNLAVELLRRLINDEINARRRKNLVQSRSFAALLRATLDRYNQGQLAAAEIIAELIELAKEMRDAYRRGEELGLTEEELAFYDALEVNDSAVAVLGDEILREIAQTLVKRVRGNISIDWALKESARARMRVIVKRILRKYGYPPDKQKKATETVIAQARLLSQHWSSPDNMK